MNRSRMFFVAVVCLLAVAILQPGCSLLNPTGRDITEVVATPATSGANASVRFEIALPEVERGRFMPSIRASSAASVRFLLTSVNVGNLDQPTSKFLKTVSVDSEGTATAEFTGIPAGPALGQLVIEGGHLNGWVDFHGAMDLVAGENTLVVSPVGSMLKADVLATTLRAVIETPGAVELGPNNIVTLIENAAEKFPVFNSIVIPVLYLDAIATILQPTITRLVSEEGATVLAGSKAGVQVWSNSIAEVFAQQAEIVSELNNPEITQIFSHAPEGWPGLVAFRPNSLGSTILATIDHETGLAKSTLRVTGVFSQVLALKYGDIIVAGYDSEADRPFIARWPSANSAQISNSQTAANLAWLSYIADYGASTEVTQPSVETLQYDSYSTLIVAVREPQLNAIGVFHIDFNDGSGNLQPVRPVTGSNQFPVVQITQPTADTTAKVGDSITIKADASDPDDGDQIVSVSFYAGDTKIGQVDSAPYNLNWETTSAGSVCITARAEDSHGAIGVSEAVCIEVSAATPILASAELLITEVGTNFYSNFGAWFEVYNNTDAALDLSQYVIRSRAKIPISDTSFNWENRDFSANMTLPARSYGLIIGRVDDTQMFIPGNVAFIKSSDGMLPWWYGSGVIEIIKSGVTIDFVRFGDDTTEPTTASAWSGANAPSLPHYESGAEPGPVLSASMQRKLNLEDTNAASDWQLLAFATPGGQNDVTDDTDSDGDGIPDSAKQPGGTYIGLPLYEWGARLGQKDLFVHINYMNSDKLGIKPVEGALDKVVAAFETKGYKLHFDVGNLFASGKYNLSNESHQVPFATYIGLGASSNHENLYEIKSQYLPLPRRQFFFYAVFGNEQYNTNSTGRGETPGNDFLLSLGGIDFQNSSYTPEQQANYLINQQASTLMHEFGHNLGLQHGGDEELNYKPNYVSIMNYLYTWGVPDITNTRAGDRYYHAMWSRDSFSSVSDWKQYFPNGSSNLHDSPWSDTFRLEFSDGTMGTLDETNLNEAVGLGNGSQAVDWNGDGQTTSSGLSININPQYDSDKSSHKDYNDWANINIVFTRSSFGIRGGIRGSSTFQTRPTATIVLLNDHQPIANCELPPMIPNR